MFDSAPQALRQFASSEKTIREAGSVEGAVKQVFAEVGCHIGGDGPRDITVHDDRFYQRILAEGSLGLGEAYQERWWDANQLDEFLTQMVQHDLASRARQSPTMIKHAVTAKLTNMQTKSRASEDVSMHYNTGNDLFERMLDKRMIYTCGYWRHAEDLDSAQVAKLDLICRKLHLEPGMTLLDIGCGWGGFAQYAAEQYGAKVVGISLASDQVEMARKTNEGLDVEIRLQDYRDTRGTFDRVVSIGMFEHVGHKNYKEFFDVCENLLDPDGVMLHHTIGRLETKAMADGWFDKYIFPGGVLPSMAQMMRASEPNWVLEDFHNFGLDYDRTLMAWYSNLMAAWPDLPGYDDHFQRTWEYYLLAAAAGFRGRTNHLWQMVFRRARRPAPRYEPVR